MTDINMTSLKISTILAEKTKNWEIGRLQMVLQRRRVVGFSKIEFVVKVEEMKLLISEKEF